MGLSLLLVAFLGYLLWLRERQHRDLTALHADLTALRQTEERLRISEERHRLLADNAMDVIWTMELDGTISYVSPSVEKMRGITPAEAMQQSLDQIHTPASQVISANYFLALQANIKAGRPTEAFRGELEYRCKDGSTFWTEVMAFPLLGPDGAFLQLLGVTRDISARKRYELELEQARDDLRAANAELHRLATTDALTGAWNRRHFEQAVEVEIAQARRYGKPLSIVLFDIDHFKSINDRYGHHTGDRVLVALIQLVRRNLRNTDVLVRWGGEEFVVMMPHCGLTEAAGQAENLRALVAAWPFPVVGTVTASFGVGELKPYETLEASFQRVDQAMYTAKSAGRNRVCQRE